MRPLLTGLSLVLVLLALATPAWADFALPALPYAAGAMEPAIDATTMTIHHDRHHAADVANLNGQIAANPDLKARHPNRFRLRGLVKVSGEWTQIATAPNLLAIR